MAPRESPLICLARVGCLAGWLAGQRRRISLRNKQKILVMLVNQHVMFVPLDVCQTPSLAGGRSWPGAVAPVSLRRPVAACRTFATARVAS